MPRDLGWIEFAQEVIRPVPAARAYDGAHIVAAEHLFQFTRAPLGRPGKIQILFEDGVQVERLVAKLTERVAPLLQEFALDVAGRGDDSDRVARLESLRFRARSWWVGVAQGVILHKESSFTDQRRRPA